MTSTNLDLALMILRRTPGRAVGAALAGAAMSGLVLAALAMATYRGPDPYSGEPYSVYSAIADPGTRYGWSAGTLMLVLPLFLVLVQALRLGSTARQRRLASLRLSGASIGDVRTIAGLETALPVLVGSLGGIAVLRGLQAIELGGGYDRTYDYYEQPVAVVPSGLPVWAYPVACVIVALLGALAGYWSARGLESPLGVTRQVSAGRPRAYSLVLFVIAGLLFAVSWDWHDLPQQVTQSLAVLLLLLGLIGAMPLVAYGFGRLLVRFARSPQTLLAGRRLLLDPRAAGRSLGTLGAIGALAGGIAVFEADANDGASSNSHPVDSFIVIGLQLAQAALVYALVLAVVSLTLHAIDVVLSARRSTAASHAMGLEARTQVATIRRQALTVGLPTVVLVMLAMILGLGALVGEFASGSVRPFAVNAAIVIGGVLIAAMLASWLATPAVRAAASPDNLRIE